MSIIFVVIIKLPVLSECFLFSDVAKTHLERMSRFWPLVIGETIIFNMASVRQFCKGGGGGRFFTSFTAICQSYYVCKEFNRTVEFIFKNVCDDFLFLI